MLIESLDCHNEVLPKGLSNKKNQITKRSSENQTKKVTKPKRRNSPLRNFNKKKNKRYSLSKPSDYDEVASTRIFYKQLLTQASHESFTRHQDQKIDSSDDESTIKSQRTITSTSTVEVSSNKLTPALGG